jgi:hypothetical protein
VSRQTWFFSLDSVKSGLRILASDGVITLTGQSAGSARAGPPVARSRRGGRQSTAYPRHRTAPPGSATGHSAGCMNSTATALGPAPPLAGALIQFGGYVHAEPVRRWVADTFVSAVPGLPTPVTC